jgi:hypothetical protein
MPLVGFETLIPVFARAKTVHALDRAATVIGIVRRGSFCINILRTYTFQDTKPCSQLNHGVISCRREMFIITALRTSNCTFLRSSFVISIKQLHAGLDMHDR